MAENASLVGGQSGIVVTGANGIELYIKGGTNYYRLHCLYYPKDTDYIDSRVYSYESIETQNQFLFYLTPKEGESGAYTNPSQLSYSDLFTYDEDLGDFSDSEIYIRKDSPLHTWLINMGYDEYINVLTPYLYFGKLYPKDEENNIIMVETYAMKDYTVAALPEHQRTENIREFFGVAFEELYVQAYYKIRNLLRLSDPFETTKDYLHYLLETFGTSTIVPSYSTNYNLDRFFISNLPALLKRKGTYEALHGIFRFLTNTSNRLNIYEQWHERLDITAPYESPSIKDYCETYNRIWQEHLWQGYYVGDQSTTYCELTNTNKTMYVGISGSYLENDIIKLVHDPENWLRGKVSSYIPSSGELVIEPISIIGTGGYNTWTVTEPIKNGAGERFYDNSNPYPSNWISNDETSVILSPHYRTEIDLSTEPLESNRIISPETLEIILDKFEELRPVARYCIQYGIVMGILTDFTGTYIDQYSGRYQAYVNTKCLAPVYGALPYNYIYSNKSSVATSFDIYHGLGTKELLIQCYTNDETTYKKFLPKNIIVKDEDNIRIELTEPQSFYAFICATNPDYFQDVFNEVEQYTNDTLEGSTDYFSLVTLWGERISNGYRYETYGLSHWIDPPGEVSYHHTELLAPADDIETYYETSLSYHADPSPSPSAADGWRVNGEMSYDIIHNYGTKAVIVEVYNCGVGDTQEKIFPVSVEIVDKNTVRVGVNNTTDTFRIYVRRLSLWEYIETMGDLISNCHHIKLGYGTSTPPSNPGQLMEEIAPSAYDIKSFEIVEAGVNGYETYNIKVVLDIKENINITEIGVFDINERMLFYTICTNLGSVADTQLTLYYTIQCNTLS